MEGSRETTCRSPVIAGIDPGTTTAYALVFLERGEIRRIETHSFKNGGTAKLIHEISGKGFPVLVACDRKKAPRNAELVARKFGTAVFSPKSDLGVAEKRELLKRTGGEAGKGVRNDHERDALASALHAYKKLRGVIRSSVSEMEKKGGGSRLREGQFLRAVLKDEDYDARSAAKKIALAGGREKKNPEEKKKGRDADRILEENRRLREKITALREELKKRESYIAQLKNEIKNLKKIAKDENGRAESGPVAVRKKKERPGSSYSEISSMLRKEVTVLKNMLEREKKKRLTLIREWSAKRGRAVLAKKLSDLSWDEFERKKRTLRIMRGDVLAVENIGRASKRVVEEIIQKGILVAASEDEKNPVKKLPRGMRVVSRSELGGVDAGEVLIVDKAGLEKIKERLFSEKSIEKIISEYKRKRGAAGRKKNKI